MPIRIERVGFGYCGFWECSLLTIIIATLPGCIKKDIHSVSGTAVAVVAQEVARGSELYAQHCASCHAPLATSNVRDIPLEELETAVEGVGAMLSLKGLLSKKDLALIVLALRTDLDTTAPATVGGFTGVPQGPNAIVLNWLPAADESGGSGLTGYKIYLQGQVVATLPASAVSYYVPALQPLTTYLFSISAFDYAGNESVRTQELSLTTPALPALPDTTAPSVPSGFSAVLLGSSAASLQWTAAVDEVNGSGVRGYRVYRGAGEVGFVNVGTHYYQDSDLPAGSTQSYSVRAVDNAGNVSAASPSVFVPVPAVNGANLYATKCQGCHGALATSDVRNRPVAAIQAAIAGEPSMASLNSLSSDEVAAIAFSLSDASDTIAPSVPGNVQAAATTYSSVRVTWAASTDQGGSGLRGYKVWRGTTLIAANLSASVLQFQDNGLIASTTYQYKVAAVDNAQNQAVSPVVSVITPAQPPAPDTTAPSVPTGLAAGSVTDARIVLTWNGSTDAGGSGVSDYLVYRNGNFLVAVGTTNHTDTNVLSATTYTYKVKARDGATNVSAFSPQISVTTLNPDGATLYQSKNCANCHGGLSTSNLKYISNSLSGFQNLFAQAMLPVSLGGIAAMQGLSLREVEIQAIGALLIGEEPEVDDPNVRLPFGYASVVGTRTKIASQASEIFANSTSTSAENVAINNLISNLETGFAGMLGGSCSRYDAVCPQTSATHDTFVNLSPAPPTDVSRAGVILNSCSQILEMQTAVVNVLSRATLTPTSTASAVNVGKVLAVYFPGRAFPSSIITNLQQVHASSVGAGMSGANAWKAWQMVQLPLCEWALGGGL